MSFSDYRSYAGLHRLHDLGGDVQGPVDRLVPGLRRRSLADLEHVPGARGQDHAHDLVRGQFRAQRCPGGMDARIQEPLLDGDQQVVGQHAEEDVRLHPVRQPVEDRALAERALHGPERRLDPREQDVGPPDLFVGEVVPIGLEQVPAVEALGDRLLRPILCPGDRCRRRLVPDGIVAGDPGVTLLQASDGLVHLGRVLELPGGHAGLELSQIRQEPLLVRRADRGGPAK